MPKNRQTIVPYKHKSMVYKRNLRYEPGQEVAIPNNEMGLKPDFYKIIMNQSKIDERRMYSWELQFYNSNTQQVPKNAKPMPDDSIAIILPRGNNGSLPQGYDPKKLWFKTINGTYIDTKAYVDSKANNFETKTTYVDSKDVYIDAKDAYNNSNTSPEHRTAVASKDKTICDLNVLINYSFKLKNSD